MTREDYIQYIWHIVAYLSRDKTLFVMDPECQKSSKYMRFKALRVPHAISIMVLLLVFYTENPNGVGGAVNI